MATEKEKMDDFISYEDSILNTDDITGKDLHINPDVYIHQILLAAQNALVKDDMAQGFSQYRLIVEHLEVLAEAAGLLPTDYEEQVEAFRTSPSFLSEEERVRGVKLATKKLGLIMRIIFAGKLLTTPLRA